MYVLMCVRLKEIMKKMSGGEKQTCEFERYQHVCLKRENIVCVKREDNVCVEHKLY